MKLGGLIIAVTLIGSACADDDHSAITVLAASSLTDVFDDLIEEFNRTDSGAGVNVRLVLGGSSSLATQLEEGAPGDAVATADSVTMARIVAAERVVGEPRVFATNTLVIAVEAGNPLEIRSLNDIANDEILVALCAPQVPCGALSEQLLAANDVVIDPVTLEPNVRSVLTKVNLGEVDAGLVYRTDTNNSAVAVIEPAVAAQFTNDYPIATLTDNPLAEAFVDFILSAEAAEILTTAGFGPGQ